MNRRPADKIAVDWLIRQNEGELNRDEQAAFEAWLADEDNADALAMVRRTWHGVAALAADPAIAAERARILRRTGAIRRLRPWSVAAGIAVMLCAGLALVSSRSGTQVDDPALTVAQAPVGEIIGTRVGERSSVTLADGSVLTLNTDSAVRVAYTAQERRIVLERGEAFFEVAKHQPQPFVVYAGGQRVVATGTAFDVRLDPMRAEIVLVEGQVHVVPPGASHRDAVVMRPGQKLIARSAGETVLSEADLDQATSWTSGRVIFRDTPLSEAIKEMNRYSDRKLVFANTASTTMRVSGVFFTGQTTRFARALTEIHPLSLREADHGRTLILTRSD